MAYVLRKYDDNQVVEALYALRPGMNLGEGTRLVDIEEEAFTDDDSQRVLKLSIEVLLTSEEYEQVFSRPVG